MINPVFTIADALDAYESERKSIIIAVNRMTRAVARLKERCGAAVAADREAVAAAVADYVSHYGALAPATISRDLIVLRAALRRAWKIGKLPLQPFVQLPDAVSVRKRSLTRDEAQRLLQHCASEVHTFIVMALTTGARLGAILELTWDRVDLERRTIDFRAPHPQAARRKHRAIVPIAEPLHRELTRDLRDRNKLLLAAIGRRCGKDDRVVTVSRSSVERLVVAAAAAAGLSAVTPHVLRHTAATWMIGDGKLSLPIVAAMLGHQSSLITEQVYTHLTPGHLTEAASLLGDMVRGGES